MNLSTAVQEADEPVFLAGVNLLRRSGLQEFQLRFQDDETPTIWMVYGRWRSFTPGDPGREIVKAGFNYMMPLYLLCEEVCQGTGGWCRHCERPSAFVRPGDSDARGIDDDMEYCTRRYDPELKQFVRGCDGNVPKG